jgi:hypothetical protein
LRKQAVPEMEGKVAISKVYAGDGVVLQGADSTFGGAAAVET